MGSREREVVDLGLHYIIAKRRKGGYLFSVQPEREILSQFPYKAMR
jgi:hypothetical protein